MYIYKNMLKLINKKLTIYTMYVYTYMPEILIFRKQYRNTTYTLYPYIKIT